MNSTWKSLLWKEWREQRWRLVAIAAISSFIALCYPIVLINTKMNISAIREWINWQSVWLINYIVLTGTFLGMAVAGGEASRRTMSFLQALPNPLWHAASAKILLAVTTGAIPILIIQLLSFFLLAWRVGNIEDLNSALVQISSTNSDPFRSPYHWFVSATISSILGVSSILIWMLAGGMNRADEVRAGAVGFLVCIALWLMFTLSMGLAVKYELSLSFLLYFLIPALPGGPGIIFQLSSNSSQSLPLSSLVLIGLISHGAIVAWYLKEFGRVAVRPKRSVNTTSQFSFWRSARKRRFPSQWHAIAWKQCRETGPLAVASAGAILSIAPLAYYFSGGDSSEELGLILAGVSSSVGFFVLIVTGIGLYIEDFAPSLNYFWRSRPIRVVEWFTVKLVTGITLLAACFGLIFLLAYTLASVVFPHGNFSAWLFVAQVLLLIYTLSMASYCLLRQPIYAAVLAIGLFVGGTIIFTLLFGGDKYFWMTIFTLFLVQIVVLAISYLAVKHDLGWKVGR